MSDRDPESRFFGVIPAGGVGSRLWPLSRAAEPKFLHDLAGTGASLLRDTWERLVPLTGPDRIMVVTGAVHADAVARQLPELHERNTVLESDPRDSAAAIGLAAAILHRRDPEVILGSFAADHVIEDAELFRATVRQAIRIADAGYIATIGIAPDAPATGFGYSRLGAALDIAGAPDARLVDAFVEKPDRATAESYLASGDYLWNAGMFIVRAELILREMERSRPALHAGLLEIAADWEDPARRAETLSRVWPGLERVAIDYAVAEPAAEEGRLAVVPGRFGWDDIGDFAAVARLHPGERDGALAVLGDRSQVIASDSSGIVVAGGGRTIALIGVEDIVVVDTGDALLVTTRDHAQQVKGIVDGLKADGRSELL